MRGGLHDRVSLVCLLQLNPVSGLLVSLVVLVASPAPGGVAGEQPLRSTRTLGTGGDVLLYSISGISVDKRNNVYVTDLLDYSVKKFDRSGVCVGKVGRRGTGPGEFRSPAFSMLTGERLIVLQMEDPRIQVFDTGLVFRGGFIVPGGCLSTSHPCGPGGWRLRSTVTARMGLSSDTMGRRGGARSAYLWSRRGRASPLCGEQNCRLP